MSAISHLLNISLDLNNEGSSWTPKIPPFSKRPLERVDGHIETLDKLNIPLVKARHVSVNRVETSEVSTTCIYAGIK